MNLPLELNLGASGKFLADIPLPGLQGMLANLAGMADVVSHAIAPSSQDSIEATMWPCLQTWREAFGGLNQKVLHGLLRTDPVGPTLINETALKDFLLQSRWQ